MPNWELAGGSHLHYKRFTLWAIGRPEILIGAFHATVDMVSVEVCQLKPDWGRSGVPREPDPAFIGFLDADVPTLPTKVIGDSVQKRLLAEIGGICPMSR